MAILFPRPLPDEVRAHPLREAEVLVYDQLAAQLDDEFVVFYSRPWLGLDRYGNEIDGEVDFVVAHPRWGILAIEVKGGEVAKDGVSGRWTSVGRGGVTHKIKDPVAQARAGKYRLIEKLNEHRQWHGKFVHLAYGVILPRSGNPGRPLGPDMPPEIFAFSDQIGHLSEWIAGRLKVGGLPDRCQPLGADGIACLTSLLASSFQLRMKAGGRLALGDLEIKTLTQEQYFCLDGFARHARVLVEGGAGTGKTLLAVRQAQIYSEHGKRVLLTCYNKPLGDQFAHWFEGDTKVVAGNFHRFATELLGRTEIDGLIEQAGGDVDRTLSELVPARMIEVMGQHPELQFDAVIVDEGQDFRREWWAAIEATLKDVATCEVRVFADQNQAVHAHCMPLEHDRYSTFFDLTRNVRNSRQVFEVASPYYRTGSTKAAGPNGQPVIWNSTMPDGDAATGQMVALVGDLHGNHDVDLNDIVVLCASTQRRDKILEVILARGYPASTGNEPYRELGVRVETVRRFKGLEASAVIVHWMDDLIGDDHLAYVALTRAKGLLIICGTDGCFDRLKAGANGREELHERAAIAR